MGMWMLERTPVVGGNLEPFCFHLNSLFPCCSQCLKPEDVAEAVIYVLSAPPHVQVSVALAVLMLGKPNHPQRRRAGRL